MYTTEQIRQTFLRLGLAVPETITPDRETLFRLQCAFLQAVPYENLDILAGRPLSLAEDALYDKLVTRRRGGICSPENHGFIGAIPALIRSSDFSFCGIREKLGSRRCPLLSKKER